MKENIIQINLGELRNSCFVVMPFSKLFQIEYEKVIKPILTELDIECIRGDEIYSKQRIMDDIWNSIKRCRFILAELTEKNPNVMYEIGLAHAIGKPVIIITRNAEDVPFDLKSLRYLFYDVNDPFWGDSLKSGIRSLIQKVIENPGIENYLEGIEPLNELKFPKIAKIKKKPKQEINEIIIGTWQGSFFIDEEEHDITLNINAKNNEISATSVVSLPLNNSVINQIMVGNYFNEKLSLKGVNYTFVKRGNLENYFLDDFIFHTIAKNEIIGNLDGEYGGQVIDLKLTRIDD